MNRTLTAMKARAAKIAFDRGHRIFWTLSKDGPHHVLLGACLNCLRTLHCDPRPHTDHRHFTGRALSERCSALQ